MMFQTSNMKSSGARSPGLPEPVPDVDGVSPSNGRAPSPNSDRVQNPPTGRFTGAGKLLVTKVRRTTVPRTLLFLGVFAILFAPCEAVFQSWKRNNELKVNGGDQPQKRVWFHMEKAKECANSNCTVKWPIVTGLKAFFCRDANRKGKQRCIDCKGIFCESHGLTLQRDPRAGEFTIRCQSCCDFWMMVEIKEEKKKKLALGRAKRLRLKNGSGQKPPAPNGSSGTQTPPATPPRAPPSRKSSASSRSRSRSDATGGTPGMKAFDFVG